MTGNSTRGAALAALRQGWSVVPLRPRDKRPLVPWEPFQHRHPTEDEIRGWFREWPNANIGIITGEISHLVVVDIDVQHGGDKALAQLEGRHGPLPDTVEVITGGGGRHCYFVHPGGIVRNMVGLASGVDVRGNGGYVVSPPSVHPSGHRYEWRPGHDPRSKGIAPLPGWLLDLMRRRSERRGHPMAYWRQLTSEGVVEGKRNDAIASFAGHLLWHGVDPKVTLELLLCWNEVKCRPPLASDEVVRTVRSITSLHESETDVP